MSRRVWKYPLSLRQAAAFIRAAKAANFRSVTFEATAADGSIIKIIASDKMSEQEEQNQKNEWDTVLHHDKN